MNHFLKYRPEEHVKVKQSGTIFFFFFLRNSILGTLVNPSKCVKILINVSGYFLKECGAVQAMAKIGTFEKGNRVLWIY